jgi:1,4-dihydroxy-2-naphthoate octaprenyltransferase
VLSCIFLIGGVYPLTQVYQHKADEASGDITISYKLGIKGTFIFCAVMFGISNALLFYYFDAKQLLQHFILFQLFLFPVLLFFIKWFIKVLKDDTQASFKNTMEMNFIASTCMNLFFIVLLILNTIK